MSVPTETDGLEPLGLFDAAVQQMHFSNSFMRPSMLPNYGTDLSVEIIDDRRVGCDVE